MGERHTELDASDAAAMRSIVENSQDNIMLLDRDARIRYLNWTVPEFTREQVYGTPIYEFVRAEFWPRMRDCYARLLENGGADSYETSFISEDGDITVWESRVSAVMRDGQVVGFAVISSNVSERRKAAADRDRLFNLSLDMLCIARDQRFERLNPAWQRVLGYSEEELISRPFLDFVHADDREATLGKWFELEAGLDVIDFENRYRCKDGSYRTLSWRCAWDPARNVVHAVARDVTAQRQMEAQLRQSSKMDAIGRLAAGVAHDFNNLILVISANVELAHRTSDPDERSRFLNELSEAARRAQALTRQLLAVGRHALVRSAAVDIAGLTGDLVRMVRTLLPPNIEFAAEAGNDLPEVEGDRGQLELVVLNLCLNARDAMPNGGRLALSASVMEAAQVRQLRPESMDAPRWVRIAVEDNGVGMSAEMREHLFEPFFTTKPAGRGTGLGLSTAYGIVQGHHGFIQIQSEPGRGSRFEVFLPATHVQRRPAAAAERDEDMVGRGELVLIVEDVDSVRQVLASLLEQSGYRVLTAADGESGIATFRAHHTEIDVVLIDVVMPKLSGPEAFQEMRTISPGVRAIFTSGYADAASFRAVRLTGAPLLPKPYASATLLRMLRRAIEERTNRR